MSKQARGFSGVTSLSSSQDALIPPQVLAQNPSWNPLHQDASEATSSHWDKMRQKVSMDSWIERQDSNMLPNINRLEQQFAARVNAGQSQSTDQDLFPGRHFDNPKEKAKNNASSAKPHKSSHSGKHAYKKHQPKDHGHDINWSMWAAAICLFLVGAGAFGVWMLSGQPDVGSIISSYKADVSPKKEQSAQVEASNEGTAPASPAAADPNNAAAQALDMLADEDTPAEDTSSTTAIDMFAPNASEVVSAETAPVTAATRAEQMSDFLFNQDPAAVIAAAAAAAAQEEQILLSPITEVKADSILSINLPALPKLKRPADNVLDKDALSPEEYRWCALVQMGTTEVAQAPAACSSPEVVRYGQELVPYLPYFKILGLYRALIEHKREPSAVGVSLDKLEADQWLNYHLTSSSEALNERDTHHCGQSWVVINGYFAMSQFGFNPDALNQQIQHFNTICGNKTVPLAQQEGWMERNDLLVFVQSMLVVNFDKLTSTWTNYTYLPPAQGTAKQMRPEITEAQKLLKQLGYKISNTKGKMNDETREAIKLFELDMGLEAKGELTFSILLRLRLATSGYDSKQAWQSPLKKA